MNSFSFSLIVLLVVNVIKCRHIITMNVKRFDFKFK